MGRSDPELPEVGKALVQFSAWMVRMAVAQKTQHPYVVSRSHVQGGEPTIRGTRVPVRTIVQYVLREGIPPEALVKEFPRLSVAAVYDALSYYYDHRSHLDKLLRAQAEDAWRR